MYGHFYTRRKLKSQRGVLALAAVLILFSTLMVIGMMIYYVYFKQVNTFLQNREQKQLNYISSLVGTFYYQNIYTIELNDNDVLQTNSVTYSDYSTLASYLGLPQTDAWNNPYIMYVSNRQTDPISGNFYHLVYIVSLGSSHQLQSSFDPSTGTLTLGGTNTAVEINGKTINNQVYLQNASQLSNLVNKVSSFCRTLYIENNELIYNYFYNSNDSTCQNMGLTNYGSGDFGCYTGTAFGSTNLPSIMGLNQNEYTNTLGQQFLFDNTSSAVTSQPQSDGTAYTARIGVPEPSGNVAWTIFTY